MQQSQWGDEALFGSTVLRACMVRLTLTGSREDITQCATHDHNAMSTKTSPHELNTIQLLCVYVLRLVFGSQWSCITARWAVQTAAAVTRQSHAMDACGVKEPNPAASSTTPAEITSSTLALHPTYTGCVYGVYTIKLNKHSFLCQVFIKVREFSLCVQHSTALSIGIQLLLSVVDRASVWSSRGRYCDHYLGIEPGPESRGHSALCLCSWSALRCYSYKIRDLVQVNYSPTNLIYLSF